eukprot:TRINITY_DN5084_c0_g1_i2.p1 TRINITY_DN5084_c0_g1~~TRINITY_DN5084_c0_g1_i2.p1  ORF type:complete len:185 (+),score=42.91 TRINITY_DN5084_c0_g1_i2:175-729(+)
MMSGLRPILHELFDSTARPAATGVQIQPCLHALRGDSPEYRGFWINGELRAVLSTHFKVDADELKYAQCPLMDQSMKQQRGRLMAGDLGIPGDDDLLNGVRFETIKTVMEQIRDSSVSICGEMPPMLRTDVAVDSASGQVVLIEIETGFDSSLFPEVLAFDIEGAVCDYFTHNITQTIESKHAT